MNFERNKNLKKKNFKTGSGSGAKLSGSATLPCPPFYSLFLV